MWQDVDTSTKLIICNDLFGVSVSVSIFQRDQDIDELSLIWIIWQHSQASIMFDDMKILEDLCNVLG